MDIETQVMQKNGLVAMKLARELITLQPGARIATIDEYSKKYEAGRGTVQAALKLLGQYQAIALEKKGHLGTYISHIDYEALWKFTGIGMVMGVMPLPYTKLYEGLATGLFTILNEKKIPFSLAYMRGARSRLQALASGRYDFAVVSALAADTAQREGVHIDCCVNFGPGTYVKEHVIIFAKPGNSVIEDGMKVGVDRSSIDQYLLTIEQCAGKQVQLVDLAYNQFLQSLAKGEIDAAVWNSDEIVEQNLAIRYAPLVQGEMQRKNTEAVIVINRDNYGLKNLFASFIEKARVVEYQHKVISGDILPNY